MQELPPPFSHFDKASHVLNCRGHLLDVREPVVMGILNVTPDSFSDGGKFDQIDTAVAQVDRMRKAGAGIIDIGGYSSRPGADHISTTEEWNRVGPVIEAIRVAFPNAILSLDTFRAEVADKGLKAGVHMINDIGAGVLDTEMLNIVSQYDAPYIAMHMQGTPATMQQAPVYDKVEEEVMMFLIERAKAARSAGIKDIIIDPGFGFGKSLDHNYALLKSLRLFTRLGVPLLVGLSRKSMLYKPFDAKPTEVLDLSGAAHLHALQQGARILRVHDVEAAVRIVRMFSLLQGNGAV